MQPAAHPPSKPAMLSAPICTEQPSVTAPAGWASLMRILLGRCERFSSTKKYPVG